MLPKFREKLRKIRHSKSRILVYFRAFGTWYSTILTYGRWSPPHHLLPSSLVMPPNEMVEYHRSFHSPASIL